jgi:hypothetical protein
MTASTAAGCGAGDMLRLVDAVEQPSAPQIATATKARRPTREAQPDAPALGAACDPVFGESRAGALIGAPA